MRGCENPKKKREPFSLLFNFLHFPATKSFAPDPRRTAPPAHSAPPPAPCGPGSAPPAAGGAEISAAPPATQRRGSTACRALPPRGSRLPHPARLDDLSQRRPPRDGHPPPGPEVIDWGSHACDQRELQKPHHGAPAHRLVEDAENVHARYHSTVLRSGAVVSSLGRCGKPRSRGGPAAGRGGAGAP